MLRNANTEEIYERYALLKSVSLALGSSLVPEDLFRAIAAKIREIVPYDRCVIGHVNPETSEHVYWYVESDVETVAWTPEDGHELRNWIFEEVYRKKKPVYIPDLSRCGVRWLEKMGKYGLRNSVFVPIMQGEKCEAHLEIHSNDPGGYSEFQISLLEDVANLIGPAIRNASLYQESKTRASHLEISGEIAKAVSLSVEPDTLFEAIASRIKKEVPCDRLVISNVDPESGTSKYYYEDSQINLGPPSEEERKVGNFAAEIFKRKGPVYIPDILDTPWRVHRVAKAGFRSVLIVPIYLDGEYFAHLNLSSKTPAAFPENQRALLEAIAGHLGPAVRNVNLFQDTQKRTAQLEVVGKIATATGSTLGKKELFQAVSKEIRQLIPCERVFIGSVNFETEDVFYWYVETDIEVSPVKQDDVSRLEWYRELYEKSCPLKHGDLRKVSFRRAQDYAKAGFLSIMVVPIERDGRCFAHIALSSTRVNAFSDQQLTELVSIASHIGPAIRNVMLHEEAQQSRDFFKSVMDDSADSMIMSDEKQRIIRWNRAADRLYGYTEAEALGRHIEFLIPDRLRADLKIGEKVRVSNAPANFDTCRLDKDGTEIPVSITLSPVLGDDGKTIAYTGIHHDLTEQKRAEEEIRELNANLEKRVEERTSDLAAANENLQDLTDDLRRSAERMKAVNRIARSVGSTLEPEALFETVVGKIRRAVPCDRCVIAKIDMKLGHYRDLQSDSDIKVDSRVVQIAEGEWRGEGVYDTGRPLNIPDLREKRWSMHRRLTRHGIRSMIIVPILQGDECIAHFSLSSTWPAAFSETDEQHLVTISTYLGPAIQNAALYLEAREHGERLSTLNQLNRKITQNLDLFEVLESIVGAAVALLKAEHSRIFLLDEREQNLILRASGGNLPIPPGLAPSIEISESISGWSFQTGQ